MRNQNTTTSQQLELNKKNVIEFFNTAFNEKDFLAAKEYLGPTYKQHAPYVPDGIDGLKDYIQILREKFPHAHSEIKKSIAEGEYVFLFVHLIKEPNTLGLALMELFRLENGKIVEHWNVVQEVPSKPVNTNGLF